MDLIDEDAPIELRDPDFRIYGRNYSHPSSYISTGAKTENSLISEGCIIGGSVIHSVISTGCTVEKGAVIENSFVMPNTQIKSGATVKNSIISENCILEENSSVGSDEGICVVAKDITINKGEIVREVFI